MARLNNPFAVKKSTANKPKKMNAYIVDPVPTLSMVPMVKSKQVTDGTQAKVTYFGPTLEAAMDSVMTLYCQMVASQAFLLSNDETGGKMVDSETLARKAWDIYNRHLQNSSKVWTAISEQSFDDVKKEIERRMLFVTAKTIG